jgi:hypothetical protein
VSRANSKNTRFRPNTTYLRNKLRLFGFPPFALGTLRRSGKNHFVAQHLFPSGPWTGFYNYRPQDKHRMDLDLTFAAGRLSGGRNDDVGRFVVRGQYDSQSLECWWTKSYVGAHEVFYRGFREGKGILGTWEISVHDRGGFHIWPKRAGEEEAGAESSEAAAPLAGVEGEVELRRVAAPGKQ